MNRRPSSASDGYWLASDASSLPPHALFQYLMEEYGSQFGVSPEQVPGAPPAFPDGNPLSPPSRGYWDSIFAGKGANPLAAPRKKL